MTWKQSQNVKKKESRFIWSISLNQQQLNFSSVQRSMKRTNSLSLCGTFPPNILSRFIELSFSSGCRLSCTFHIIHEHGWLNSQSLISSSALEFFHTLTHDLEQCCAQLYINVDTVKFTTRECELSYKNQCLLISCCKIQLLRWIQTFFFKYHR